RIAPDAKASIASRAQRFVTIAKRPSCGRGTGGFVVLICPAAEAEYFCFRGLTRFLKIRSDLPVGLICRGSPRLIGQSLSAVLSNNGAKRTRSKAPYSNQR
ncbi:MAG TPA: hypothetical protein VJS63_03140, partial [Bradyrhizobium sp.]|nr:hypothetical protein [Bradyrhizobium sp.]